MTIDEVVAYMSASKSVEDWNKRRTYAFSLYRGEFKHFIQRVDGVNDLDGSSLIVKTLGRDDVEKNTLEKNEQN
jgi:hypothetical protein